MPLIPAVRRHRQDLCAFKASLIYVVSYRGQIGQHRKTLPPSPPPQKGIFYDKTILNLMSILPTSHPLTPMPHTSFWKLVENTIMAFLNLWVEL